jgi:putative transposase
LAFEPYGRFFLGFYLSRTRNILTAELFLCRHPVYSDGADWYPAACRSLGLEHHVYDALRGNLMERFVQYVKDRTEGFDDYFPLYATAVCLRTSLSETASTSTDTIAKA